MSLHSISILESKWKLYSTYGAMMMLANTEVTSVTSLTRCDGCACSTVALMRRCYLHLTQSITGDMSSATDTTINRSTIRAFNRSIFKYHCAYIINAVVSTSVQLQMHDFKMQLLFSHDRWDFVHNKLLHCTILISVLNLDYNVFPDYSSDC